MPHAPDSRRGARARVFGIAFFVRHPVLERAFMLSLHIHICIVCKHLFVCVTFVATYSHRPHHNAADVWHVSASSPNAPYIQSRVCNVPRILKSWDSGFSAGFPWITISTVGTLGPGKFRNMLWNSNPKTHKTLICESSRSGTVNNNTIQQQPSGETHDNTGDSYMLNKPNCSTTHATCTGRNYKNRVDLHTRRPHRVADDVDNDDSCEV